MSSRGCWLTLFCSLLLSVGFACAQANPASGPAANPGTGSSAMNVATPGPDDPVITLEGICDNEPYSAAKPVDPSKAADPGKPAAEANGGCKSVITRADFESLVKVANPKAVPRDAIKFARFYSEQLVYAHKARALSLDKDPDFETILKFTSLQVLSRKISNRMMQDADVPDAEIEKEIKEHPEKYEQVDLLEIAIPKAKQHPAEAGKAPAKVDARAEEAAMKAEAEKIRSRAVAGGDFQDLQDEVYKFAGLDPDDSPDVEVGKNTRDQVPEEFRKLVFELQPGKVSELVSAEGYWHLFEVRSKQMMPVAGAKAIAVNQRFHDSMEALKATVTPQFNDAYFTPPAAPQTAKPGEK